MCMGNRPLPYKKSEPVAHLYSLYQNQDKALLLGGLVFSSTPRWLLPSSPCYATQMRLTGAVRDVGTHAEATNTHAS